MTSGDDLMAHWPLVLNYVAVRLRGIDRVVAEDIAADTVAKALTRYTDIGNEDGLKRWLLTTARNAVIDWTRRRSRSEVGLGIADINHGRLDAGSERHAAMLDVRAALDTLKPIHRETAVRWAEGWFLREIAVENGRSKEGIEGRKNRAIELMRPLLESTP